MRALSCAVVALALAAVVSSCGDSYAQQIQSRRAVSVTLQAPQPRQYVREISRPGRTEATRMIPLVFLDGGHVTGVFADETDRVRAAQVLACVDTTEIAANVARARVALAKARRDYDRARRLTEQAAIPANTVEDAQSALDLAEANLRIAEHHLRNATLRAPVDGVIVRRMVERGQLIGNTSPAMVMMVLDPIKVMLGMTDADFVRVSEGDTAVVTVSAMPEYRGVGRVTRTGLVAASDGTFPVEISLPNPRLRLPAGMICQVAVRCGATEPALTVPIESVIVGEGDRARVYVYDEGLGIVRRRYVTVGSPREGRIPVLQGISAGDRVVVDGIREVRDGSSVTVADGGGGR